MNQETSKYGIRSSLERLKIIRQIAEMLGKKKMASLDVLSEIDNIELEHGLAFSAAFSSRFGGDRICVMLGGVRCLKRYRGKGSVA